MAIVDPLAPRVLAGEPVMRDLRLLAIEGFVALPKRGMEVGGLLFGQADGGEVRIAGFEEVPCEHRYGPSYALSKNDREQLAELLANRPGGNPPVIGFFRSFASRDPVIEEADEAFIREHFPSGDFVFLVLQPLSPENCLTSLRFFRDGQLLPETEDCSPAASEPATEATPDRPLLPPSYRTRERESLLEQAGTSRAIREEAPAWPEEPAQRRTRWWIPAVILLASVAGGAAGFGIVALARAPRWTELSLNAHPANGLLEVSWDAGASRVLHATRGLLAVKDANMRLNVELGPPELRTGKYTLPMLHGDVELRLILYAKGLGVAGDSLRLATLATPEVTAPRTSVDTADRAEPAPVAASGVAVQPLTVHEVQPAIPEGIRSRISGRVVIPVEVQVSARGRVLRAAPEPQTGGGLHRYLAEQAAKAAREWRFAPARTKSGSPVAASKVIDFVFTR